MRLPPERRLDLLAVLGSARPMQALIGQLRDHGFGVDIAHDLASARSSFFGAGGHHCVVVGPDVAPGVAAAIVGSLREVDPELPTIAFGGAAFGSSANPAGKPAAHKGTLPKPAGSVWTAQVGFHPGSRAGAVALIRFLRDLPERG